MLEIEQITEPKICNYNLKVGTKFLCTKEQEEDEEKYEQIMQGMLSRKK
jgi:hypothetical protein